MTKTPLIYLALIVTFIGCGSYPVDKAEAAFADVASFPSLDNVKSFDVVSEDGRIHVFLMTHQADEDPALLYLESRAGGWSTPIRVDAVLSDAQKPSPSAETHLAARGTERVAVWRVPGSGRFGSGPLATAYSNDGGQTWHSGPNPADDGSTGGHAFIDVTAAADGFHLVWLDSRDGSQGLRYSRSVDGGRSWEANQTVDEETCECCWNQVRSDDEKVHVLYRDKNPRDMALASLTNGRWTRTGRVGIFNWDVDACPHVGGGLAISPRSGELHALVWTGREDRVGVYYQRSLEDGWTEPRQFGAESARHSDLTISETGRLVAVWDSHEGDGYVVYSSISVDDGRTWSDPRAVSDSSVSSHHPRVISRGERFAVVWQQGSAEGEETLGLAELD